MRTHILAGLFTSSAIYLLGLAGEMTNSTLLIAPFGASCVLLFGFPESPLVKTRNVVVGHLLSSVVGLIFLEFSPITPASMAMATGIAVSLMLVTKTSHPAAGANPILIMTIKASWTFLIAPILIGVALMLLISLIHRRILKS